MRRSSLGDAGTGVGVDAGSPPDAAPPPPPPPPVDAGMDASTSPLDAGGGTGPTGGPLVLYNWNPGAPLAHYAAVRAAVTSGASGTRARVVFVGDSTTEGVGSADDDLRALSYPDYFADDLPLVGVPANIDDFVGGYTGVDDRVALVGGSVWSGAGAAGGALVYAAAPGDGLDFTLDSPGTYDRLDVHYVDGAPTTFTVSLDDGTVVGTFTPQGSNDMATTTFTVPAGAHGSAHVRESSSGGGFLEGVTFWSASHPSFSVYNAGIGGLSSNVVGTGSTTGYGDIQGALALHPDLVIINLGINDLLHDYATIPQVAANLSLMTTMFRAAGSDVILVVPTPFGSPDLPTLRAAMQGVSDAMDVPLVDLSATYHDDVDALSAAGFMYDGVHPNAKLYSDIGAKLAVLLE